MKVLVTGGAGYIGSTVCSALIDHGHTPVVLDSLVKGCELFTEGRIFYKGDIADQSLVERIFLEHPDIGHVIHCAALILVPESVTQPYEYYRENVAKSVELFHTLNSLGCRNIIFSSSASLYDDVPGFMVTESSPLNPRSPYARTKYMIEMVLRDFSNAYDMKAVCLRYFNPIGADPRMRSGMFRPDVSLVLKNMLRVASGQEPVFNITGVDWPTRDGSGIRDYVHVWDLAEAHVKAVEHFDRIFQEDGDDGRAARYVPMNLGTGRGVTVKELVAAFESVLGRSINKVETDPRPGDVAGAYANGDRAGRALGWKAVLPIEQAISDALTWEKVKEGMGL